MVTRMQVTLDDDEHRQAKKKAAAAGVSLAEYIRRVVAADLADTDRSGHPVHEVFDLGSSAGSDVAQHKDAYVGEATAAARTSRGDRRRR
jgi:hypothetical protein